ncbi:LRR receptor-like serine/threonine-protein kinase RGI5 isoform X1 [Lycium barbarum]|uniref:LRR receptor-like serine/threonine-protein kinase RGI5 isoform X1 n=1 Tax=Lycium barbarum TaxID=112863 RepID=UPI00293EBAED|nr:LRR receptor-like serine/threonine-protein kinase RGI5 isoform X1 [Lycium barbarum]
MILENYKLQKVLHVSTFKFNLLSVSKLTKQLSCSVSFYPDFYLFQELFTGRVIGIGRERDGLYILREQKIKPAINTTVSKCSSEAVAFETGACINEDIRAHQDITKHHKQEYTIQLNLSEGDLSGRIPPQVGNLTHLTRLDLSRNNLHGPIPTSLLNLQSLCYLDLSENSLSGNLPAFQMKSLQYMDLRGNKLDGPVPKSFLNLQSLYYLDLSDNSLSEYLPAFRMKSLRYIDLGSNCFTGQIPREYGALQSLETLYIYNNLLNGGIPQELGKLSNLVVFAMNDNRLSGHIPYQLGWLTQLQYLDLSTNYFVGELPLSFKQLTNLIQFVAHGNSLSGKIPKLIANWKELGMLILLGNNFKGPWPKEISSMDSLLNLQLSNVVTKGRAYDFPDLSPMTSLEVLTLRNCSLRGRIPSYIWELQHLSSLDLSFNELFGEVPKSIRTSLTYMPSTSQRPGYTPEMFTHYDPWISFPQAPVSDLHTGDRHEDLDLDIIFDDYFLRPTARPTAPSASPAPRAAQEPSHMSSQEPVDTQVHSSAPVDPFPLVQIGPSPPPAIAPGSAQETVEEPAKDPSDQPSQEAVDTQVHSSDPVVQSPSIESSPEASNEAT